MVPNRYKQPDQTDEIRYIYQHISSCDHPFLFLDNCCLKRRKINTFYLLKSKQKTILHAPYLFPEKRSFYFAYCSKLIFFFLFYGQLFPPLNGLFVSFSISLVLNKQFANNFFFRLKSKMQTNEFHHQNKSPKKAAYLIWEKQLRKFTVTNNSLHFNLKQSKWNFFFSIVKRVK